MNDNNIVSFIIIISLIVIIYKYFEQSTYDIVLVKSNINNKSYLVRNLPDKQQSADLLGIIATKLEKLVNIIKTQGYETIYTKYLQNDIIKENSKQAPSKQQNPDKLSISINKNTGDSSSNIISDIVSDIASASDSASNSASNSNSNSNSNSSSSSDAQELVKKIKLKLKNDIDRLIKNFNPNAFSETTPDAQYTSYSVNKGEKIVFCLRNKSQDEELVKENIITFVAIHELGHLMTKSIGHEPEFWNTFKLLLKIAIEHGIYKNIDFNSTPKEYCGVNITDTPLKL